jgi:hypothetical protein
MRLHKTTDNVVAEGWPYVAFAAAILVLYLLGSLDLLPWLDGFYRHIGFNWSQVAGPRFSTVVLLGLMAGVAQCVQGAVREGWPRFRGHDRSTLVQSALRALFYRALAIFVVGSWGSELKAMNLRDDSFEFVLASVVASFLMVLPRILDDFLSSAYVVLSEQLGK